MSDISQVSVAQARGENQEEKLLPVVYEELLRLAARYLTNEQPGQTLQATALVHEAYLRLVGFTNNCLEWYRGVWQNRAADELTYE